MNIKEIKGIGDKTAALFSKLNIFTSEDLINYYPRNYDCFEKPVTVKEIDKQQVVAIKCFINRKAELYNAPKKSILSLIARDENNDKVKLVWFNMPFLKNKFQIGATYIFRGRIAHDKADTFNTIIKIEQPDIFTIAQYEDKLNELQPIYSLTKGLSNNLVIKSVKYLLENQQYNDYLSNDILQRYDLLSRNEAIRNIHFPLKISYRDKARQRLVFDEFLQFQYTLKRLKNSSVNVPNQYIINDCETTQKFLNELPFKLTNAQNNVWTEIKQDMSGPNVMNRLIQGDVGSGKTILAVLALLNTALSGYQGALMAPTEVLAVQHYENISSMIDEYNLPIRISLLTGSMTQKQKRFEYDRILTGVSDIIIGTHALIQTKVEYHNLALVITDEQHRFGVCQRENLSLKGSNPHILVMSATPIPRTLAIILYGDLDISVIDELPADRLPIKNCVVGTDYRPNAYKFIEKEIKKGHQAYVICSMVDESDNYDAENVIEYSEKLRQQLPDDITIEYLHGKMKPAEKNDIMYRFSQNEINVLVSTTVIEVGINVPNATVMMIEDAQRFGLAGLHQLRGRVGRGNAQSYCIFVNTSKQKSATERLDILNKSNDGFYIASEDMKLRGPGDFFGLRQSGDLYFKIGDIYTDSKILKQTSELIKKVETGDIVMNHEEKAKYFDYINSNVDKAICMINL